MADTLDIPTLLAELSRDEGRRLKPYLDTVGKTTIGVGRNLTDVGIAESECDLLLENDVMRSVVWLDRHLPWWRSLDAVRQRVLINMAFNLGGMLGLVQRAYAERTGLAEGMSRSKKRSPISTITPAES
ncbi:MULTISPECIES: lysozyme [Burkholderiaceae]|uniref:glycoside hydrolase family protein n=1 Tax=Burkholderiaceae TaxID=119060 RepID=UPI00095DCCB9|nr:MULTISPECIES: lysozyme [Burkholderiaceae]SIT68805.1 lysozyme [Burkholderia sp. b14]